MNLEEIQNKVPQTILKYAIPSIIAMILTSLITIIDGFFVGNHIGKEGLAAINLGLPIIYLFLAFGIMIGVGGSAIATRLLGSRNVPEGNAVFNQTLLTALISSVILSLGIFALFEPILGFIRATPAVLEYFRNYYLIMLVSYPIMILNINFGMFIRGEGRPETFMMITIISVAANIILDYLFIVVFQAGIAGIAKASLISVTISFVLMVLYFLFQSKVFKFKSFTFSQEVLRNTFFNGSSELIGQLSMSVTMLLFNYVILKEVGVSGIAAFTIVGYVSYLFSMVVIGFGQGASPLISYSFGANRIELSRDIRRKTNLFVVVLGILTFLFLILGANSYCHVFVKDKIVQDMVSSGSKIFSIAFLFMGFNIISSFYFTSIGLARESAIISGSRGLVVLLICILVLPALLGIRGVWLVAPVTEIITVFLTLYLLKSHDKRFRIPQMGNTPA